MKVIKQCQNTSYNENQTTISIKTEFPISNLKYIKPVKILINNHQFSDSRFINTIKNNHNIGDSSYYKKHPQESIKWW